MDKDLKAGEAGYQVRFFLPLSLSTSSPHSSIKRFDHEIPHISCIMTFLPILFIYS